MMSRQRVVVSLVERWQAARRVSKSETASIPRDPTSSVMSVSLSLSLSLSLCLSLTKIPSSEGGTRRFLARSVRV